MAETSGDGAVRYLYGRDCAGSGLPVGELRDGDWLYYLNDATGYLRQGTDEQGEVVSGWLFNPDGVVLEGPEGPVSHLICGGVYDWSTGLIYKGGRYFDPLLGIWLALAPLVVVQSWKGRKKRRGFPWHSLLVVMCVSGVLMGCGPTLGPPSPIPGDTPDPTITICVTSESPLPTPESTDTPEPPSTDTPEPPSGPSPAPPGWEWKLFPLDNPERLITISHYNIALESNHPLEKSAWAEKVNLMLDGEVRKVTKEFLEQLAIQGSGYLDSGTGAEYNGYVHWEGGNNAAKQSCAVTFNQTCGVAWQTGAVSPKESDRDATGMKTDRFGGETRVYIESLNREIVINDTGGAVDKYQIDVFTGFAGSLDEAWLKNLESQFDTFGNFQCALRCDKPPNAGRIIEKAAFAHI